ncbi:hypothetical protein RJ55_03052 [Drechmeria coniospora]|nr:hypothetical protein RJ55_03052 [Drechmeria coniospora]
MATATRPRGFLNLNMAPGSSDKHQPPMGRGFSGSHLYPNKNIWTSSLSSARERSINSQDSDENHAGSSALNANSEAHVWASSSSPWNSENAHRSSSTSPSRTRDGSLASGSAYFDQQQPAAIGHKAGGAFAAKTFHDESAGYASAFTSQQRSTHDTAAYMESMAAYAQQREPSLPPSRQSQGSPAFPELYRGVPTPSGALPSQRHVAGHQPASYSTQSANQRAFNLNKQIDDDLFAQVRRMTLDGSASSAGSYSPAQQQSFQFNPGSQPWVGEGGGGPPRYDPVAAQYAAMRRPSDQLSPGPNYRLDSNSSPRSYQPSPDAWAARPASRQHRPSEFDRRPTAVQYASHFHPPYFPSQYSYPNMPVQYAPDYLDPYGQSFRNHPMMASYGIHTINAGYSMSANLPHMKSAREQDIGRVLRSQLLNDYRLNNKANKHWELKEIYNHIVEFSGDQHGSRFIQQRLETANSDEKEQVFREIEPNAVQLMKDVFGNYVVQKVFDHGNQVQKKALAEKMKGKVVDLSLQVYGCRVVQKALEHVLVDQQAELARELEPEILRVMRDQNGNHVVQKIIELLPRRYIDFIVRSTRGQVPALASHTYGCRVIQRLLEYGTEADKAELMAELHASAGILIIDQYGNYVAQHVIAHGTREHRERMIELVMTQVLTLSKHKYASNVVENCIEFGSAEHRTRIRELLTTPASDGTSPLQQMMRDQYGNYVIQKLLDQLHGAEREAFVEDIKPQFFSLKKNGATKQLQALEKLLELGPAGEYAHGEANSPVNTPPLTDATNSSQGSSPPSRQSAVAVAMPNRGAVKRGAFVAPRVRPEEA